MKRYRCEYRTECEVCGEPIVIDASHDDMDTARELLTERVRASFDACHPCPNGHRQPSIVARLAKVLGA
jgi:hypothetical protein